MKAVQYNTYGGPDVLEINENAPKPSISATQVLVEVYAASVNPFDSKVREGYLQKNLPLIFPVTIGGDFSGVVTEVGKEVMGFNVGDEVYGQSININGGSGSFAEFIASNAGNTAIKAKDLDYIQSASLPLVGVSAIQALEQHINLQKGQKILINGGAGGVGSIAIQLAKAKGAYVATTVSSHDVEFAKQLGADEVIDYKTQAFETMLKDFDAVFDTVGQQTTDTSFAILKPGSILVAMSARPNENFAKQHKVTAISQATDSSTKNLDRLRELVEQGIIRPQIDKVFPFDQAKKAFKYAEEGHPKGKVVIKIKE